MDAEVGIIGIGTMGSMAAWQLSKKGVSVIGFEQFGIGHDRAAAGGETRIFRTAYKEGSEYVPLLKDAYNLWRDLEDESRDKLLNITEGLTIGDSNSNFMKSVLQSVKENDLSARILNNREGKKMYPQHKLDSKDIILVDSKAGYLRPQQAITSAVNSAMKYGAKILNYSTVERIEQDKSKINITVNGEIYSVKKVLVTAGPWSKMFVPKPNEFLEVRRLVNAWFLPKKQQLFSDKSFPVFTREYLEGSYYGLPAVDANMVKIGMFATETSKINDPDKLNKNVGSDEADVFSKLIKHRLPDLYENPARMDAYMEIYTKDKHPIIGYFSDNNNVLFMTGFSGHGFKMSPIIGKIGADLLQKGESDYKIINQFSPQRFL